MTELDSIIKTLNKKFKTGNIQVGVEFQDIQKVPFSSCRLNYMTYGGLPVGRIAEFSGSDGSGKALVNGTPILSSSGWVSIENSCVGDKVFGEDGELHTIIGVFPQGKKDCYRITFSDNSFCDCSADHLWQIQSAKQRVKSTHSILTTKQILDKINDCDYKKSCHDGKGISIPTTNPINHKKKDLPIDAYTLGLLLGDGGFTCHSLTFTNTENDIIEQLNERLNDKYNCCLSKNIDDRIQYIVKENKKSNAHPIKRRLTDLGLLGKHSNEKFIPSLYFYSDISDRYDLLVGLINTDGTIHHKSCISFSTSSKKLYSDFMMLCNSLGIYNLGNVTYRGGKSEYSVSIGQPNDEVVKRLSNKHLSRLRRNKQIRQRRRIIKDIVYIGKMDCTCIKVDNPTELFITKDYIVTHNTTTALDVAGQCQKMFSDKRVFYCDIEATFDSAWATKLGVDIDNLILYRPDSQSAEEVFQTLLEVMDTGEVSMCILDSLGAMVSDLANEKDMTERTYGGISQSLTLFTRKATPICARTGCIFIGINQIRDDMNSTYGGVITTGGRCWRHGCTTRLSFRKGNYIDERGNNLSRACENPQGNIVNVSLEKSKVCPPDRKVGFYTLRYLTGIDYVSDMVDVAIKEDIVHQSGAWFSIIDKETGEILTHNDTELKFQGKPKLVDYLKENNDLYEELLKRVQ